jgi:hypothetical protein
MAVELLSAGLARLPRLNRVRDTLAKQAISALSQYEEEAKAARRGIFQYGDPGTCGCLCGAGEQRDKGRELAEEAAHVCQPNETSHAGCHGCRG